MTEFSNTPNLNQNQSIKSLTVRELETLIKRIVKEIFQEEISNFDSQQTQKFLETFASWQDTRTPEEIIEEIYSSRSGNSNKSQN